PRRQSDDRPPQSTRRRWPRSPPHPQTPTLRRRLQSTHSRRSNRPTPRRLTEEQGTAFKLLGSRTGVACPCLIVLRPSFSAAPSAGGGDERPDVRQYFGPALRVDLGSVALASLRLTRGRLRREHGGPAERS